MNWYFKKSINLGFLRINFSSAGIGLSFGVKGIRIGKDAKGRVYKTLSIPGTGVVFKKKYSPPGTIKRIIHKILSFF